MKSHGPKLDRFSLYRSLYRYRVRVPIYLTCGILDIFRYKKSELNIQINTEVSVEIKPKTRIRSCIVCLLGLLEYYKSRMIKSNRTIFEPQHDKNNKMTCAPSEDSDQPGHPPSLISLRCGMLSLISLRCALSG